MFGSGNDSAILDLNKAYLKEGKANGKAPAVTHVVCPHT